jgi:spermidine/putrescine transport system ATP-binding protein
MSDIVVVLQSGEIQQTGTPKDIYDEPKNVFVANFIGKSNIIEADMIDDYRVTIAGTEFECLDKGFGKNAPVDVVIRPEDIKITTVEKGQISGKVKDITFNGSHYAIYVTLDNKTTWSVLSTVPSDVGSVVGLKMIPDAIHVMKKS